MYVYVDNIIFCFARKLMVLCVCDKESEKGGRGREKRKLRANCASAQAWERERVNQPKWVQWYWKMCVRVWRIENKRTKCTEWQILSHVMGYWFDNVIFFSKHTRSLTHWLTLSLILLSVRCSCLLSPLFGYYYSRAHTFPFDYFCMHCVCVCVVCAKHAWTNFRFRPILP